MENTQCKMTEDMYKKVISIEKHIQLIKHDLSKIEEIVDRTDQYWEGRANEVHIESYKEFRKEMFEILKGLESEMKGPIEMAEQYFYIEKEEEDYTEELPDNLVL